MKAPVFRLIFATGVFFASALALHADTTNELAQGQSRFHRSQAPNGTVAEEPGLNPGMFGAAGVLTDEQRASLETALNTERPRMAQLQAELRAARENLFLAGITNNFNENALRQQAMASLARIDAEMLVVRLRAFSKVQPPLTAEQIERIKSRMHEMSRPPGRVPLPLERAPRRESGTDTNEDANGLPPKH